MFEIKINGKLERERERANGDQKLENKNLFNLGQKIFFMCLLVFIFGLGFGAKASAATYYVSQIATNGYQIGVDTNNGSSKDTPFLTMGKAINIYSAGDTIILNDGSYLTTDGAFGATYFTLTKAVTINSETTLGATITSTSASYTIYINPSATGTYTFGSLILNSNNVSYTSLTLANTAYNPTLVLNGTKMLNPTLRGIRISEDNPTLIDINNASIYASALSNVGTIFDLSVLASGNVDINGLELNITAALGATTIEGIRIASSTGTGSTVSVRNVTGSISCGTGNISPGVISISNVPSAEVSDFNFTFTGAGTYGINIITGSGANIHDGIINFNVPAGYVIYSNAPSTSVYGNSISNNNTDQTKTPHGIDIYNTTGGHIYQNIVSGFCPAYLAALTDSTTIFEHNIVINPYGTYQLYAKGATGSKFYNNTIYAKEGYNGICMGMKDNGGTHSTGVEYKNNICYNTSTSPKFLFTDANQTATFASNLYYAPEALVSTSWQYGGINYNTFAGWQNIESSAVWGNPVFNNVAENNFSLQNTSPAINAGTNAGLTTDFEGNPKSGPNFDIGAYEFQDSTKPITSADIVSGTYNSVQLVTLTCDDGVGVGCDKTYYTLTGIDPTTSSTVYSGAISIPDNDTTVLKFFSRDKNENSETPIKSKTYTIDTIFPQTSIDSNPNALINTNSATFTFSASETSTFQCKMDSGAYASCTTPKNYTSLSEGVHTFYVKATDTATNEDATPASYTFTVDTEIPTISNLSPNNTTLSVTTTSINLTLTTSETTTCKYSTTSGTDYASMTAFDSTNNTTHSTNISGLNADTAYDYYIICKDAINESAEAHLTFSIAPEENKTSLNYIKIKIERETNKFKDKIYSWKNKFKLKGDDSNLANGTVKIYKDNKRIETIDINTDGSWDKILKLKDEFSGWIKIRQYDQFGTLLSTDKAKIKVDTEDPKFNEAIPEKMTIGRNQKIYFTATDDNSGIDYYKVKLVDIRDWRQQNEDFYQIPEDVPNGTYDLFIRAYDKTGNYAEEKTTLNVSQYRNSVSLGSAPLNPYNTSERNTLNTENKIQNNTDKNTDTSSNNSSSSNFPSLQPQSQPSTSHWWNPFSWF